MGPLLDVVPSAVVHLRSFISGVAHVGRDGQVGHHRSGFSISGGVVTESAGKLFSEVMPYGILDRCHQTNRVPPYAGVSVVLEMTGTALTS